MSVLYNSPVPHTSAELWIHMDTDGYAKKWEESEKKAPKFRKETC